MTGAPQANMTQEQYIAVITKINMIGGSDGWWVDTGASRHVCYDRAKFKTYTNVENKKCCWVIPTPLLLLELEMLN